MQTLLNKKLILLGRPQVLKNGKEVFGTGVDKQGKKKRPIVKSKGVLIWQRGEHLKYLKKMFRNYGAIDTPVNMKIISFIAYKHSNQKKPDADNLYAYPQDLLEKAGLLLNDNLIEAHEGSRRVCICDGCKVRGLTPKGNKSKSCGRGVEVYEYAKTAKGKNKTRTALCPLGLERVEITFTPFNGEPIKREYDPAELPTPPAIDTPPDFWG